MIPGTFPTGIIFAFTYMCTHFCPEFTLLPFPPTTFPLVPTPPIPDRVQSSCSLILEKKKDKKKKT
jgi:hypothetical protein